MVTTKSRCRARWRYALAGLAAVGGLPVAAHPGVAAEPLGGVPIATGAGLDWGLKQSWRTYIGEQGTRLGEGATRNADGTFHFPVVGGAYDASTHTTIVQFGGSVEFLGHCEPRPTGERPCVLDLTIRNPRIVFDPDETMLHMETATAPVDGTLSFTDIPFAAIELGTSAPVVEAGVTTWSDLSNAMTPEAAGVFTYAPGTPLDLISFAYDGDGSVPVPAVEQTDTPGAPLYRLSASIPVGGEGQVPVPSALAVDGVDGVVHAFGGLATDASPAVQPTTTLDAATLAVLATTAETVQRWHTPFLWHATDTATGDTFVSGGQLWNGSTRVLGWDPVSGAATYETPAGLEAFAPEFYAYDAPRDRLVATSMRTRPFGGAVAVATRGEDGTWTRASYPYPAGTSVQRQTYAYGSRMVVTPDGDILATTDENSYNGDVMAKVVQISLPAVDGETATVTAVPGGNRYSTITVTPDGTVYAARNDAAGVARLAKVDDAWQIAEVIETAGPAAALLADPSDPDTVLVAMTSSRRLQVIRDGVAVSTIAVPGAAQLGGNSASNWIAAPLAIGSDRRLVVGGVEGIYSFEYLGDAATIVGQPADVTATLHAGEDATDVVFTAAAADDPAITVQWQERRAGSTRWQDWTDIEGANTATLTVPATREANGTEYRARFLTQRGGEIVGAVPTDAAVLTVNYDPTIANQTGDVQVATGTTAEFQVRGAGHPEPAVTWQRYVGGFWSNLTGADDGIELDGGFLRVRDANLDQSGTRFRARLTNAAGSVTSTPATLTVVAQAGPGPDFPGSGTGTWGIRTSYRNYIAGPIAHGEITVADGASWTAGPGNGKGPFELPITAATFDAASGQGEITFAGSIYTGGHDYGQGRVLESTWSDLRLRIDAATGTGTIVADLVFRPFVGADPSVAPPALQTVTDVEFATVDLAGVDWTPGGTGLVTVSDAAVVGVPAAMQLIGWDAFYSSEYPNVSLDPLSLDVTFATGGGEEPEEPEEPAAPVLVDLAPARLADTRPGATTVDGDVAGTGIRPAGSTLSLTVAGRGGVPTTAGAVALNVTAADGQPGGYVTVWPCGDERPNASSLNTTAAVVANAVVSKVGAGGKVCLFTSVDTHLIVDVNGHLPAQGGYAALTPARLTDTRAGAATADGVAAGTGPSAPDGTIRVPVAGRGGVPATGVGSVMLNVTVADAATAGFVTVWNCDAERPLASNLNGSPAHPVANAVVTGVAASGDVCIYTETSTHVIVDVTGWFGAGSAITPLTPTRVLDTRAGAATIDGAGSGAGHTAAGQVTAVRVAGRGAVPVGATSVVLNVTATDGLDAGYVTVHPCGSAPPNASNLNYGSGAAVANLVVAAVDHAGDVCIYTSDPVQLVVDALAVLG